MSGSSDPWISRWSDGILIVPGGVRRVERSIESISSRYPEYRPFRLLLNVSRISSEAVAGTYAVILYRKSFVSLFFEEISSVSLIYAVISAVSGSKDMIFGGTN